MNRLTISLFAGSLLWAACAVPKQPPPLSPVDPSSPEAPQAVEGPPAPSLKSSATTAAPAPAEQQPSVHEGMHHQHGQPPSTPVETPETAAVYACPMHPEIRQNQPGRCSICGMPLARQKTEKEPPR